jgi:hypothetical protein
MAHEIPEWLMSECFQIEHRSDDDPFGSGIYRVRLLGPTPRMGEGDTLADAAEAARADDGRRLPLPLARILRPRRLLSPCLR